MMSNGYSISGVPRGSAGLRPQKEGIPVPEFTTIRRLLEDLRGSGFTVSLTLDGIQFTGQKVVAFENGLVYTVDGAGVVRATVINQIDSVDF